MDSILNQIDAEIARLLQIRSLLASTGAAPNSATALKSSKTPVKAAAGKTRVLSAEARKRIADAQRRRWAAQKAKSK